MTQSNTTEATFSKKASIINYLGTRFDLQIERKVSLLTRQETEVALHASLSDSINFVAYQTENQIQNAGADWTKENGLLSIWLLGMFTPSENTVVIIPFHPAPDAKELINTNCFGDIPEDRLTIRDRQAYYDEEVAPEIEHLRAGGYSPESFAYPYGSRTEEADAVIRPHVRFMRTTPGGCPYP